MRILHLADRLTNRGGAYTWTLGVVEGLSATHEQRLARYTRPDLLVLDEPSRSPRGIMSYSPTPHIFG